MYLQRVETPENQPVVLGAMPGFAQFGTLAPVTPPYELLVYLKGEGANGDTFFTDEVPGRTWAVFIGTPTTSTARFKFGGASLYSPTSSAIQLTSGLADFVLDDDYTIEAWVYASSAGFSPFYLYEAAGSAKDVRIIVAPVDSTMTVRHVCGAYSVGATDGVSPLNRWIHVYAGKRGENIYVGINGVVETIGSVVETFVEPGYLFVNSLPSATGEFMHVDELWLLKGICRYTASFTPAEPPVLP